MGSAPRLHGAAAPAVRLHPARPAGPPAPPQCACRSAQRMRYGSGMLAARAGTCYCGHTRGASTHSPSQHAGAVAVLPPAVPPCVRTDGCVSSSAPQGPTRKWNRSARQRSHHNRSSQPVNQSRAELASVLPGGCSPAAVIPPASAGLNFYRLRIENRRALSPVSPVMAPLRRSRP